MNPPATKPRRPRPARAHWHTHHLRAALLSGALIASALGVGVVGYHALAGLGWIDALLDASMILGGMGPVSPLKTDVAKLFASFYALFSGIVFLASTAILLTPSFRGVLHRFHMDLEEDDGE